MKNQKDGHRNKTDNNKPLHHTKVADTEFQRNSPTQEDVCQEKQAESQQAFEDRIKISDRWMIRLTAALVFVSIVSAAIYYSQLWAMKTQADIMQGQLIAAQDSIKIAKDTLEDARKSGIEQSDRAERLTKANEKISEASQKSLDATIEKHRVEQRAWIGIKNIEIGGVINGEKTFVISEGSGFNSKVIASNIGKTPARVLTTRTYLNHVRHGTKPILKESAIISSIPKPFTLFPGGEVDIASMMASPPAYSKEQITALKNGEYVLYLYGMITYQDVFGHLHWTQFCHELDSSLTKFTTCPFYNEAN